MNKLRAKRAFLERRAEEQAEEAKKAAAEAAEEKSSPKGKRKTFKREEINAKDPLLPVVTEEQLSASGSDPVSMQELRDGIDKASGNMDPSDKRYSSDEAKRSIHYPYATGPMMATFFDRMRLTKRSFYFQEQNSSEVKLVEPDFVDTDEDAVAKAKRDKPGLVEKGLLNEEEEINNNRKQRDQWYGMCRMEYVSRQQQYRKKRLNSVSTFKLIIPLVVGFLIFLGMCWPMWDYLLDIETNNHYSTLGLPSTASTSDVKKAYRAMVKQWHPDHNPECGQQCRDMMMKIQEAYDKLSARGVDAEELELKRENQLKEALHQIRNLIFFKAYSIAFFCAEYINMLVLSLPFMRRSTRKARIENIVRILVVVGFSAAEVILVTGFNLIIILQIFYFAVNMVTGSASKKQMEKWLKRSNFDFKRDLMFFVLPSLAFHCAYFAFFERYPKYDVFIFDCALGFAYVAAHLAKYSPNLFDNFALKKCSLTTQYMKATLTKSGRMGLQYTRWNFWSSEFSIILDDLFAYTSSIPAVFRLVVICVHVCYLIQLRLLPWDAPITGKLGQRYRKQQDAAEASAKRQRIASSPLDDSDDDDEAAGDFAERLRNQSGNVPLWRAKGKRSVKGTRFLSDTEREWFTNVDSTGVLWMDIPYCKYSGPLARHRTPQVANTSTQLCMTPNMQEVLVVHVSKNRQIPASVKDPQLLELAKSQPIVPQFRICDRFYDPDMCVVLYRDMKATLFLNTNNPSMNIPESDLPFIHEEPVNAVYRRCGGVLGYHTLSNNETRECSLLKGGVACAGIRRNEPVVSFAVKPADVNDASTAKAYVEKDPSNRRAWRVVANLLLVNVLLCAASLGAVYGLYMLPEPTSTLRNPKGGANRQSRGAASLAFEPFLTPVCTEKYMNLLPSDHLLNTFASGAIVIPPIGAYDQKLPIPIFVPDLWDSLRQLSLFTSSNGGGGMGGGAGAGGQQQQQQQQGQQQQKGGGKKGAKRQRS